MRCDFAAAHDNQLKHTVVVAEQRWVFALLGYDRLLKTARRQIGTIKMRQQFGAAAFSTER